MRKMKKFARGGSADRAKARLDRRMADIEKDYKIALAKGKSESVAKAKREQRIADAKDDYAKRTGADRTQTRAAEKAAEEALTAARRSRKAPASAAASTKPSVLSRATKVAQAAKTAPKTETKKNYDDMSFNAAFGQAMKDKGKGGTFTWKGKQYKLEYATDKKPATPSRAAPSRTAPSRPAPPRATGLRPAGAGAMDVDKRPRGGTGVSSRAAGLRAVGADAAKRSRGAPKEKSPGRQMSERSARRQQEFFDQLGGEIAAPFRSPRAGDMNKAKGGKVKKYAKGGKIDGCAVRGKTRAKRTK
jgi:hypothetical protein